MVAAEGAGLAAIQVGVPARLFIVDGHVAGEAEGSPAKVFINPEILEISSEAQTGDEGCLSFPNIFVPVKRGMRARVRATDLDGNTFESEGEGLFARALQHETDHLNGKLLVDQVGPVKREIINKEGPLNDVEWEEMRTHPKAGYEIIKNHPDLSERSKRAVLEHHEDRDGTGYPLQVPLNKTDLFSRIVAISPASPTTRVAIITASPICVPATLSSPARAPWRRLLAMIKVTVGPGTMTRTMQATT